MSALTSKREGPRARPHNSFQNLRAHSPGGARMGHASLMRPVRPLPTVRFVGFAATPWLEHCRGDHRGQSSPGAWYLHFRDAWDSTSGPQGVIHTRDPAPHMIAIVVIGRGNVNGPLVANDVTLSASARLQSDMCGRARCAR